jgi:hypothetical protein
LYTSFFKLFDFSVKTRIETVGIELTFCLFVYLLEHFKAIKQSEKKNGVTFKLTSCEQIIFAIKGACSRLHVNK